jgi:hypothetical protein
MKDGSGERSGFPFAYARSPHPSFCERTAKVRDYKESEKKNKTMTASQLAAAIP